MLQTLSIMMLTVYICGMPVAFVTAAIANNGVDSDGWKTFLWAFFWPVLLPILWFKGDTN